MNTGSKRRPVLWIGLIFGILVAIVNPVREMLTEDDGWAYARSVRHLVETGSYKLDSWAAASMPAQIGIAAAASHLFGYSLTLLRCITLIFLLCSALSLYGLLREFGTDAGLATALSLALMCSPIVLYFGFTFMTDVQFIGWTLSACLLYVKGLRRGSAALLLLASVLAAMAVGTRQFGVALPVGLVFTWILARNSERPGWFAVLCGAALPTAVFAFQLWAARTHPVFTQSVRMAEQALFLRQPPLQIAILLLARTSAIAHYIGLFLAALMPALLVIQYRRIRADTPPGMKIGMWSLLLVLWAALLVVGLVVRIDGWKLNVAHDLSAALLPSIPWLLEMVLPPWPPARVMITFLAVAASTALFVSIIRVFRPSSFWQNRTSPKLMLASTGAALFCLHLMYVQLNDTYIIAFLPFTLLALGLVLREELSHKSAVRTIALSAVALGIALAVWMRGDLNRQQAIWQASADLMATGADKYDIRGSYQWVCYHSAFDDWIETLGPGAQAGDYLGWTLHRTFNEWLSRKSAYPRYFIWEPAGNSAVEDYHIMRTVQYRDALMRLHDVHVFSRNDFRPLDNSQR